MESASLTAAHAHARNASLPGSRNSAAAVEEHNQAADAFSSAAKGVDEAEALRILKLLEEHHRQLARIIDSRTEKRQEASAADETATTASPPADVSEASHTPTSESHSQSDSTVQPFHPPTSPTVQIKPPRELSSNIASNLATARGIPRPLPRRDQADPLATELKNAKSSARGITRGHAMATTSKAQAGRAGSPARSSGSSAVRSKSEDRADEAASTKSRRDSGPAVAQSPQDDTFSTFYSQVEGLISKISAPLAFAGLPLRTEDPKASPAHDTSANSSSSKPSKPHAATAAAPSDVDKLFSRAALRAIQEERGSTVIPSSSAQGRAANVHDSFFVVHTDGSTGTVSYANIASRAPNTPPGPNPADDEFVDALSQPSTSPPTPQKRPKHGRRSSTPSQAQPPRLAGGKTPEELQLENETLRALSDTLSKRLYMWETSAQERSEALQASIRGLRPPTGPGVPVSEASAAAAAAVGPGTEAGHGQGPAHEDANVKELEEQLRAMQKDMEKVGRENDKLRTVVGRYRERWEKLKEGARVRREGTGSGGTGGAAP